MRTIKETNICCGCQRIEETSRQEGKEDNNEVNAEAYIQAMIQAAIAKSSNDTREGEESGKSRVTLKSILKPAKNSST